VTRHSDPYKVLQVDPEAEDEVIAAAYRRLARKYHPDVASSPEAAERMAAINAAWAIIGEPASRAAFDRERTAAATRAREAARRDEREREVREAMARHAAAATASAAAAAAGPAARTPGSGDPGRGGGARPPSPEPETVSRDWSGGRSSVGSGYDPSMRRPDGEGAAGPPPGDPSGSVLNFGRYAGWSIGEIARRDLEYLEWLDRAPIGRQYRDEIDDHLRRTGRRRAADAEAADRRGLFRRR
jgi:curved DNA-binding protein CbpA